MSALHRLAVPLFCIAVVLVAQPALASPQGDALAQCLIRTTTPADKVGLIQWIFSTMSLNPQVKPLASISADNRTRINRDTAALFQQLLTKRCVKEAREAIRSDGQGVVSQAFNQLGQMAARDIFNDPAVMRGMSEFTGFIDGKAMEQALGNTR